MTFLSNTAKMDHFMELLMSNPERYSPLIAFLDQVSLDLSELSWKDCEIIAKQISEDNHSSFCTGLHQGILDELNASEKSEQKLDAILDFAKKLNNSPKSVNKSDIQLLLDTGWSEQTVEDTVALVAAINSFNTLAVGLGFEAIPQEAFAQMGKATISLRSNLATYNAFLQNA